MLRGPDVSVPPVRFLLSSFLSAFATLALVAATPPRPAAPTPGTLKISVALVDADLNVKPVPLHALRVFRDREDTTIVRTGMDGSVEVRLSPGRWTVESLASVAFGSSRYRWTTHAEVRADAATTVTLSNDDAVREPAAADPRRSSATELFERYRGSVFMVEAGLAHGTGFLADTLGGVVVTNAHVVENADPMSLSIRLDAQHRVAASVLARDETADIAILAVHPKVLEGRLRIALQRPEGRDPVAPGEQLIAMGYPLHQDLTITAGIASSIRSGAIISDVNINPGNSGGPLLNLFGEVVAVNTFGDVADRGAGVSGSILISRAGPALAIAAEKRKSQFSVGADPLPVMPSERLSISALKAHADTVALLPYDDFTDLTVGGFDLSLQTPMQTFIAIRKFENEIAKDRKKREARAGLSEEQRYSEVREYRDWAEYVGDFATPVVKISVMPKLGETGGSAFARLLISPQLRATYRFQGDVRGVRVFREGQPVMPILGGHTPMKMFMENQWVSLKDVADQGIYVFDAELLRPDSLGVAPSLVVAIEDLKNPKKLKCRQLPGEVVARAWNDFEGFYKESRPDLSFRRADLKASRARRPQIDSDSLRNQCSWYPVGTSGISTR